MAIIKCPECGGNVSDMAKACPHCGRPICDNTQKPKEAQTIHMPAAKQVTTQDEPKKSFFEKYRLVIIVALVLVIGAVVFFAFRGQDTKQEDNQIIISQDTCVVDSIITDEEYIPTLPTFSEFQEFLKNCDSEGNHYSPKFSLLCRYDEVWDGDSLYDGPLEFGVFYGINAKVSRNKRSGKYTITATSDHAMVYAACGDSDTAEWVLFNAKEDYDVFKLQAKESDYPMDMLSFDGLSDGCWYLANGLSKKWYQVSLLH